MKKTVLITLLTLLFAGTALAQPGRGNDRPGPGRFDDRPGHFEKGDRGERIKEVLDLTDDQMEKFDKINLDFQKEILPLRAEMEKLRAEKQLALTADKVDRSKVNKLIDQMGELRTKIQQKGVDRHLAIREILTEEQRVRFDEHMLSRKHRPGRSGHGR